MSERLNVILLFTPLTSGRIDAIRVDDMLIFGGDTMLTPGPTPNFCKGRSLLLCKGFFFFFSSPFLLSVLLSSLISLSSSSSSVCSSSFSCLFLSVCFSFLCHCLLAVTARRRLSSRYHSTIVWPLSRHHSVAIGHSPPLGCCWSLYGQSSLSSHRRLAVG